MIMGINVFVMLVFNMSPSTVTVSVSELFM
jgi:hypothetical protein